MFFDPTMKPETKADPFNLDTLIAWLEKQPAARPYCYYRQEECLVAQYLKAHGVDKYALEPDELRAIGWSYIAQGDAERFGQDDRWNFGAALERARALRHHG